MQKKANKDPFLKLQSSLSLEDLLAQPSARNSQNWLLTYLDVFVLIVMLVITLITVSDINTKQQVLNPKKASTATCPPIVTPTITSCPPPVVVKNEPIKETVPDEHTAQIHADSSNTKTGSKKTTIENNEEIKVIPENPSDIDQATKTAEEDTFRQQLAKTIDEFGLNKSVNIKVNQGYAQLEIQDNVLFKSSEADLTASGGTLLKRLMPLLKQSEGLVLIEGHTDNIPIKTPQFPSNWELAASRATSVLHFLVLQQLDSNRLRAITYADTMPIADNSTEEGRKKNRRVNILIKLSKQ
ncbi:MAG: OmpA/MotB family protein [Methylobacter sp.]